MSLVPRPDPAVRERRIAGLLFFATCCSVFAVNLVRWEGEVGAVEAAGRSLVFTTTLMAILLAHEMGHYAVARHHGFRLSMPWFVPVPFLVGTLGAIIRLRELPRTRGGLLEMGAAGPLAGLVVVAVVLAVRLVLGGPEPTGEEALAFARPMLWWVLSAALTTSEPPVVTLADPLGFAAWIGCLLTAMNLLPFGQLDGGHVVRAIAPRLATTATWITTGALVLGGLAWPGWALWVVVLHLLGARRPIAVRREQEPLPRRSRWVAGAAAAALLLCFTPVPVGF